MLLVFIGKYTSMLSIKALILQVSLHLHNELKAIDTLLAATAEKKLLHESLQRNCHFAHPENLLRAMLGDNETTNGAKL